MDKRLRSSLRSSAEEFLAAAVSDLETKNFRSTLKTLICNITANSDLCTSLPASLHVSLSRSLDSFTSCLQSPGRMDGDRSSRSPPVKRARRWEQRSPSAGRENAQERQANQSETLVSLREIRRYAFIVHLCVSHPKKSFTPSDFLPCVRSLHDCLILFEEDEELLSEVTSLCEKWWKDKLPEKEGLISQSLPFLLSRSLTANKKTYVHRVYTMREAFLLFDFLDESIEDLKLLLLRSVITPVYLKTDEGRRFIAFMLRLDTKLLKEALALIKSQIPFGRKTVLEAYADVLFSFWKNSEDSSRIEIEDSFLQSLIEGAIYASSKSLANSIRRVLRVFFDNRATDGIDKLLFRLSEPILFRSLQVANSNVRQNALYMLIDMFPLENPEASREDKTVLLEKQYFLMERLLADDSPDIRSVAVEGCCRVLHLFWEVIPSSTITKMLTKIIDDMSHDSSNDVKLSTLKGITYLLGNPQTLEVLKVLLPRLGFLFLDPFLSIRIHICDLLLAARAIRNFQFNKVVDLDILLSSLSNDHPVVAQKIVTLLMPSYFPSKLSARESCARFITLIKRSPSAGSRFCEFTHLEGSSPKSLIELAKVCYTLAASSMDLTPSQTNGLLMASANLCRHLSQEATYKLTLSKFFSKEKLKSLLPTITSVRAQNSILSIVSSVHPEGFGDFHDHCMQIIKNCPSLTGNLEIQSELRRIHRLMISNGWSDDLFGALADTLKMAASMFSDLSEIQTGRKKIEKTRRKKKKKKISKNLDDEEFDIIVAAAWQVKDLLLERETRVSALTSPFLESISSSLGAISRVIVEKSTLWEGVDILPLAAYTTLCLYRSLENVDLAEGVDSTCSVGEGLTLEEILEGLLDSAEKLLSDGADPREGEESPKSKKVVARETPPLTRSRMKETLRSCSSSVRVEENKSITAGNTAEELNDTLSNPTTSGPTQVATYLLKFTTDVAILSLIPPTNPCWPNFAATFLRHLTRRRQHSPAAIRTPFTYSAKLLHLLLSRHVPPSNLSSLTDHLLDLAATVEFNSTTKLAAVARPWLPDLLLSLASSHLSPTDAWRMRKTQLSIPLWVRTLAMEETGSGIISAAVKLLKGNTMVREAVGKVIVEKMKVALEVGDYEVVLGLVKFLCVKMEGDENGTCGFVDEARTCVVEGLENFGDDQEDKRSLLESAINFLREREA